jgi:hypothetical protein
MRLEAPLDRSWSDARHGTNQVPVSRRRSMRHKCLDNCGHDERYFTFSSLGIMLSLGPSIEPSSLMVKTKGL